MKQNQIDREKAANHCAIIGIAGRFPGAPNIEAFWRNLRDGVESIAELSDQDLEAAGVVRAERESPSYVRARPILADPELFDADFFGFSRREAEITDPQRRLFLECAWQALEVAGYDPKRFAGEIGVFAGQGTNQYRSLVARDPELVRAVGSVAILLGNEKDHLATSVSYKLGLRGPSIVVQTACSTSLVAVHLACQSLLDGECDMALAGGVTVLVPQQAGYRYQPGGIHSPDGHCRPFDADAAGTVSGSGVGVVLLKPLLAALDDGDHVHAVILGSAINNDGSDKVGYTAPSIEGQARVIREAMQVADVEARDLGYIEAHGTGTELGDPIEVAALTDVLGGGEGIEILLGSVKGNLGHLDAAAGVAGLIKTVLALEHGEIPASVNFRRPNPRIDFAATPFRIVEHLSLWHGPRCAGVSAFGIGGTNAHVILGSAPPPSVAPARSAQLLQVSARTPAALEAASHRLGDFLTRHPRLDLADVADTLRRRRSFEHRAAIVCRRRPEAVAALHDPKRGRVRSAGPVVEMPVAALAFLFPGQAAQEPAMAAALYEREPGFRTSVDHSAESLQPTLGFDLREVLLGGVDTDQDELATRLRQTAVAQPALFVLEVALARLWMSWGLVPAAMLGHSLGELVAAHLSEVLSLEDALRLVALRGQMMQEMPPGAMLALPLPAAEVAAELPQSLVVATINAADRCVVAGAEEAVDALAESLARRRIRGRRLATSHAFHSPMMAPAAERFAAAMSEIELKPPRLPFLSNVTGTWITAEQATDPSYWGRQLRETVQFAAGLDTLLGTPGQVLIEVGPGSGLCQLVRRRGEGTVAIASLPRPESSEEGDLQLLAAVGDLWLAGVETPAECFAGEQPRRRIALPGYPFERQRYWVDRRCAPSVAERRPTGPGADTSDRHASAASGADRDEGRVALRRELEKALESELERLHGSRPVPEVSAEADRCELLRNKLCGLVAEIIGADAGALRPETQFVELGFDSLSLMQLTLAVEREFRIQIAFRQLFDELPSVAALAEMLDRLLPEGLLAMPDPDAPEMLAQEVLQELSARSDQIGERAEDWMQRQIEAVWPRLDELVAEAAERYTGSERRDDAVTSSAAAAEPCSPCGGRLGEWPEDPQAALEERLGKVASPAVQRLLNQALESQFGRPLEAAARAVRVPSQTTAADGRFGPWRASKKHHSRLTEHQQRHLQELIATYTARTRTSKERAQEDRVVLADIRSSADFSDLWKEMVYPLVVDRSEGSRIWDVDGNEYVDLVMGFGVSFFGHRPPFVVAAIEETLRKGYQIGPQTELAGEVARLVTRLTGMDRVAFCNTGSEAVLAAQRLARTVTGRNGIVQFKGSYHGLFDGVLARPRHDSGFGALPVAPGIPPGSLADVAVLDYGSDEALEQIRRHRHRLAAVMVEPVQSNRLDYQPREFLAELRALTEEAGIALIFDEVITGFRSHPGGAQALFGIQADLASYGKVIAGGMPIGVVAGKARFMDSVDGGMWHFGDDSQPTAIKTFFAGTFSKHPLALAAAKAVLGRFVERGPSLQEGLNRRTEELVGRLESVVRRNNFPVHIVRFASLFRIVFEAHPTAASLFTYHLRARGIHVLEDRGCFLSAAHDEEDLKRIEAAVEESLIALREGGLLPPPKGGGVRARQAAAERRPITAGQKGLWVAAQLGSGAYAYNEMFTLRMRGPLRSAALAWAVQALAPRHEALRLAFDPEGEAQLVFPRVELSLRQVDLGRLVPVDRERVLESCLAQEQSRPFDLTRPPLLRALLLALGRGDHALALTMHHSVTDSWSFGVLSGELATLYAARSEGRAVRLPPAGQALPPAERALAARAESENFWRREFADGWTRLELPTARPRPALRSYRGAKVERVLDRHLRQQLKELAVAHRTTLFVPLLAASNLLLHRITSQGDLVNSFLVAGQADLANPRLVGYHLTHLPLRSRWAPEQTWRDYLDQVRRDVMAAHDNAALQATEVLELLGVRPLRPGEQLLPVTFNFERSGGAGFNLPGLEIEVVPNPLHFAHFELALDLNDRGTELFAECVYDAEIFERSTVAGWLRLYEEILERLVADSGLTLAELETALGGAVDTGEKTGQGAPAAVLAEESFFQLLSERPVDPQRRSIRSGRRELSCPARTLEEQAAIGGCEVTDVLCAVWLALLGRYARRERIAVVEVVPDGIRQLVCDLNPQRTLAVLVAEVAAQRLSVAVTDKAPAAGWCGVVKLPASDAGTVQLPVGSKLLLEVGAAAGGEGIAIVYDADLLPTVEMDLLGRHLESQLRSLGQDWEAPLARLSWSSERQPSLESGDGWTMEAPESQLLHRLIEAQASRTPQRVAVECDGLSLTFGELDRRANRLAHSLRRQGIGAEGVVGLYAERSIAWLVATLGVLKAGAAYLPLPPDTPPVRLAGMLEDAAVAWVLSSGAEELPAPAKPPRVVTLAAVEKEALAESELSPQARVTADNPAYVIFTSGSTGRPKGVVISHRAICNRLLWGQATFPLGEHHRCLQGSPLSADPAVWDFFAPSISGACLILPDPDGHRDPEQLVRLIEAHRITHMQSVPTLLDLVLEEPDVGVRCSSLERLWLGGEELRIETRDRFHRSVPQAVLHNPYGPTEATIDCTDWICQRRGRWYREPIGKPIGGSRLRLTTAALERTPHGMAGELSIGGPALARGYAGAPARTAERFVPDPWSEIPGARLYRTGDIMRWRADGVLEFLGRDDRQINLNGVRLELGEVEAAIARHPKVERAIAGVRKVGGRTRLLAWALASDSGKPPDVDELMVWQRQYLPGNMHPAAIVMIENLPRGSSGKLDASALPLPAGWVEAGRLAIAPRNRIERALAELWSEILGVEEVGVEDDFFALGGDSIRSIQIASRARAQGLELQPEDFFLRPTVAALAAHLESASAVPSGLGDAAESETAPASSDRQPDAPIDAAAVDAPRRFPRVDLDQEQLNKVLQQLGAAEETAQRG